MRKFIILNRSSTDSTTEGDITLPVDSFMGGYPES